MNESIRDVIRSSLLGEAGKVKVKVTLGDKKPSIRKYPITGRKADNYKQGTWAWILGVVDKWGNKSRKPELEISVLAWDLKGQAAHDSLGQVFKPNSGKQAREDVKAAKKYAKALIEDGAAMSADVVGRVKMSYEKDQVVDLGRFEIA